jgi:lipoprotein-releasing system permease protein
MLSDPQLSEVSGVKLTGIDVESEATATEFRESLARVSDPELAVADPERPFPPARRPVGRPIASVILGEKVLGFHGLARGDRITLMTAVPDPSSDMGWAAKKRQFVVAGAFRSGENEIDLERVYVEREQLARFLAGVNETDPLPEDAARYSEVLVKVEDGADVRKVRQELALALSERGLLGPDASVRTWYQFREMLLGAIENERVLMGIMLSLILLVAGFTIFAILSMMVTEKRRDVGILTALGATPNGVLWLFLLIGFWDALIGATLGAVAGTWLAIEIDPIEQWLSEVLRIQIFDRNVYIFDSIPSVVTPAFVAMVVLGAFVCTLLFAAVPAWRAASLDPVEALRNE